MYLQTSMDQMLRSDDSNSLMAYAAHGLPARRGRP
jgi:hypothetical protein